MVTNRRTYVIQIYDGKQWEDEGFVYTNISYVRADKRMYERNDPHSQYRIVRRVTIITEEVVS